MADSPAERGIGLNINPQSPELDSELDPYRLAENLRAEQLRKDSFSQPEGTGLSPAAIFFHTEPRPFGRQFTLGHAEAMKEIRPEDHRRIRQALYPGLSDDQIDQIKRDRDKR